MTEFDTASAFAAALVDEWARCGVTRAVIAPGSRSTPLALALVRDARIAVDVMLDERSASFRALGISRASGRPAVLCCTSGTAAANFHPAVLEAAHARVPLLVATADRPPELRDAGAGQTIDQTKLYGDAVRWYCDPGSPELPVAGAGATWRALACRAVAAALGPPAGPVHLNLPFREPLVPTGAPLAEMPGRADGRPWTVTTTAPIAPDATTVARLAATVRVNPRGVVVAGWGARVRAATVERFARAAGWPVLADPISGARAGAYAVSTYEALLRVDGFGAAHRPDLIVRVGAPPTSKVVGEWLDGDVAQIVVDPDGAWLDPRHAASERVVVEADALLDALAGALERERAGDVGQSPWLTSWLDAERAARAAMDRMLDDARAPYEGVIARDLVAMLPDGASLVVASSLPVRALEWCMAPRTGITVHSNRGVNGIDGFVSTAGGIAAAANGPVIALCGDLCFLHDSNGLLGASTRAPVTYVVIDNDGGGIFSFLPQAPLPEFELLFGTPHGLDLVAVAEAHGVVAERIDEWRKLEGRLDATETQVLVVPVDRAASVDRHREIWGAVAAAIESGA
jgi:2-succinyl-5-enolpyruvyl-6-hydroxy-3-cyclohexene-1-carboxylate synthase